MKKNSHIKKGKLALLAVAGAALVTSLIYDKKYKEEQEALTKKLVEDNKEKVDEVTE